MLRNIYIWTRACKRVITYSSTMSDIKKTLFANEKNEFVRKPSAFRKAVSRGPDAEFPAERGRYHLYVSKACPWAHRTLISRKLKGLEDVITVDVVYLKFSEVGWMFAPDKPGCTPDTVNGLTYMKDIYLLADKKYDGRYTVPVLWDKKNKTIVNNESSEIIRMFNSEFNEFCSTPEHQKVDLYPENLREEIDELNEWIYNLDSDNTPAVHDVALNHCYRDINNGVYRAGFATSQEAYDKAVHEVFAALDRVEGVLSQRRYLTGDTITEADVRLFTTLVRFDVVYVGHFKCNIRRIVDYPNLWGYLRDLYQTPGFGETTDLIHIRYHYQQSHLTINPHGIVAAGPAIDFTTAHDRAKKFA